jgi:hypothetical protein
LTYSILKPLNLKIMKNLILTFMLFAGFAASDLMAQACKPSSCCPPGCCAIQCCIGKQAATAEAANAAQPDLLLVAQNVMAAPACTMTKKEMKACMKACKSQQVAVSTGCQPAPSCLGSEAAKKDTEAPAADKPIRI